MPILLGCITAPPLPQQVIGLSDITKLSKSGDVYTATADYILESKYILQIKSNETLKSNNNLTINGSLMNEGIITFIDNTKKTYIIYR